MQIKYALFALNQYHDQTHPIYGQCGLSQMQE
jgi:hypothetical protein